MPHHVKKVRDTDTKPKLEWMISRKQKKREKEKNVKSIKYFITFFKYNGIESHL